MKPKTDQKLARLVSQAWGGDNGVQTQDSLWSLARAAAQTGREEIVTSTDELLLMREALLRDKDREENLARHLRSPRERREHAARAGKLLAMAARIGGQR